jgi:tetratricopeptide (TPR) repeat protein
MKGCKLKSPVRNQPDLTTSSVGWRMWRLRLAALLGVPLLFFGLLELGLRLAGFGHPTAFLLPSSNQGEKAFMQNNQFGWRFFGARMSRLPHPISILRDKAPGTIRVFVFGESAAFGDPQPRFGLPRMLQAMLEVRHPDVKLEVVNAAMTGIDSDVIVPIARDCAHARADIWVIYMGNNEVVGPFGAGTVFGPQAPPWPLVRASLALKTTRTGQLLDSLRETLQQPPPGKSEWGGMTMFLNQQVPATDPRLANVYRNFERNLADIIRAGHDSGAGVVLSTVAVNLRDCAPFASHHRANLSDPQRVEWEARFKPGVTAQQAGSWREAEAQFRAAAQIDDAYAELRFRLGQCLLALGEVGDARNHFTAARDLDALRFRCDSRLNDLIRQAGAKGENGVLLADAESVLAATSPDGLPGADAFYEHVHPTFEGNYILARAIAEQVEKLLPRTVGVSSRAWPGIPECARRLGYSDRARQLAWSDILGRLADPPFSFQANHDEQRRHWVALARRVAPADSPEALREARRACEDALLAFPDDALLYQQLGELKQAGADYAGAEAAAKRSLALLPSNQECWLSLGLALAQEQRFQEGAAAFRRVFELDPQDVWGRQNLAICLRKTGRRDEAIREFRRALAIKPRFGLAWLGLGQVYEEAGRQREAEECYRQALANRIHRADELTTLARFCQSRGWFEAACTNYSEAIELSPSDPRLRLEAGLPLAALGRHADAARCYKEAIQLSPDLAQAHFLCGLELGKLEKPGDAEREFREAARLMPDLAEARLNLGIALYRQEKLTEALKEFEQVLQRNPTNALASKYLQALRDRTSPTPAR